MKPLIFLLILLACLELKAQEKKALSTRPEHPVLLTPVKIYPSANDSIIARVKKRLQYSNERFGIIHLSQDRMPCIIPNPNRDVSIPNSWKNGTLRLVLPGGSMSNGTRKKNDPALQLN